MHGFHFLVLLVVGSAVRDTQCGFKVRAVARRAFLHNACTRRGAAAASRPAHAQAPPCLTMLRPRNPPHTLPISPLPHTHAHPPPPHVQLLTRGAARLVVPNQRLQRFAFDVELVYLGQRLRVPLGEVQVGAQGAKGKGEGGGVPLREVQVGAQGADWGKGGFCCSLPRVNESSRACGARGSATRLIAR